MANRTMLFLMAALLILSAQIQPRAQSSDEEPAAKEKVTDCPCGDPAILVPFTSWPTAVVDCSAGPSRTALYGFSFEGGIASFSATTYGRDCQFTVDAIGLNGQQRPISQPQVKACSVLILSYAQALKDAGRVAVSNFGCNLR